MKRQKFKARNRFRRAVGGFAISICLGTAIGGCAAYDPQGAAQQWAPNYYNRSYASLDAEQKMQLENHLASQSNQAWRTTAQVAMGLGHLAQGTGILLFAAKH